MIKGGRIPWLADRAAEIIRMKRRLSSRRIGVVTFLDKTRAKRKGVSENNFEIAVKQAKDGRDPWFRNRRQVKALSKHVSSLMQKVKDGKSTGQSIKAIAEFIKFSFIENFEKERSRGGVRMKGIDKTYRARKRAAGGRNKIFQFTGQLKDSIRVKVIK